MNDLFFGDSSPSSVSPMLTIASNTTFVVTSNLDDGSEDTLRWILENSVHDGDVITFALPAGQETIVLQQALEITCNITIDGGNQVTIDANSQDRIFKLDNEVSEFSVKKLSLTGGSAGTPAHELDVDGSVIYFSGGSVHDIAITLDSVTINSNNAAGNGGAVFVDGGSVSLNVINTTISNSSAQLDGGAIFMRADNVNVTFSDSSISDCSTIDANGNGGAVNINATGDFTMLDGSINNNNTNANGGAIWNYGTSSLTGYIFANNSAVSGGAVYNEPDHDPAAADPVLTIKTSVFTENHASVNGGAVCNDDAGMVLQGITFNGNSADGNGGALYNGTWGSVVLKSSYFLGNSAGGEGAAFYNAGTAELNGTKFSTATDTTVNRGTMTLKKDNSFAADVTNYGSVVFDATSIVTLKDAAQMINDSSAAAQEVGSTSFVLDRTSVRQGSGEFADIVWQGEWGLDNDAQYTAVLSGTTSVDINLGGSFDDVNGRTVWFGQNGGVAGLTDHVKLNSTYAETDFQKFATRARIDEVYDNYNTVIEITGGSYDYDLYAGNARFEITGDVELERASLTERGRYLFGGAYKAAGGNNSVTVKKDASISADRVYGGSAIANDCTLTDAVSSVVFEYGSSAEISSAYAGYLVQSGANASLSGDLSICSNGNVQVTDYIIGGDLSCGKAKTVRTGNTSVSISSGIYDWVVAGSGMVGEKDSTYKQIGDSSVTITGGIFSREGIIFGGCITNRGSYGVNTRIEGNTSITIDVSDRLVSIACIYAGSNGAGVITGNTTVKFTGDGSNLTFNDEYGGVSGDCAHTKSYVEGTRSLLFEDYTGKFDAPVVQKMDSISFEGSTVTITSSRWKAAPISNWSFDISSSVVWAEAKNNSFKDDTLVFGEAGDTLSGDWTVIDSTSVALFEDWDQAASVTLLGQDADWSSAQSCWVSADYKLYVDSVNFNLIVAERIV